MPDLTLSMRGWSGATRNRAYALCLSVGLPLAVFCGWRFGHPFLQMDTEHYLNLASGRPAMLPFASRQLGPLIVRGLAHLLHVPVEAAFVVEGCASLLFFFATVVFLLLRSGAPGWMAPAVVGLYFWPQQFGGLALPDLLYAALLCGFLLLLRRQYMFAAALMMFPLTLSRESTLLTVVCFLIAGWKRLRVWEAGAALASTLAGVLVVRRLTVNALPNQEHISPMLYLVAKMPWNFLKNFLGLSLWANLYPSCEAPKWQIALHVGPLHALGYCGFVSQAPIELVSYALASFGLLPLVLLKVRWSGVAMNGGRESLLLRFCVVYGVISFAIAPLLGESFTRLYGYSWPLFLVALPMLLGAAGGTFSSMRAAFGFLTLHLLLSWAELGVRRAPLLIVALVIYALGWLLLRGTWRAAGGAGSGSIQAV